ncbi:MAG: pirin family protein [Nocardioidaceae bacterium]|nr:pirin family protein [Nocardioidaceae bacterium]
MIEIRPGSGRFVTREEGRETFHSFSFGRHYDPVNVGFAAMVALNDENLPPGTGYDEHPHRDTEIVTLVLAGALRHTDASRSTVLSPGTVMRTSAGSGIVHAERTEPGITTRFLQTWLRPDEPGVPPSLALSSYDAGPGLSEVGDLGIGTAGARLYLAQQATGRLLLPDSPLLHVFVVDGTVDLGDRAAGPGDAARLTEEGGRAVTVEEPATLVVWAFG